MLTAEVLEEIRKIGSATSPQAGQATRDLLNPLHLANGYLAPAICRDRRYGQDPRQRLDVHTAPGVTGRPVLVFVHGGGFGGGDKTTPGSPYYDNVGGWATARGMVAVTTTYRLAPAYQWPTGAADVAATIGWIRDNIADHGGDRDRIVLMGHSAGAAHVASYLAGHTGAGPDGPAGHTGAGPDGPAGHAGSGPDGLAGAVMVSGFYDLTTIDVTPPFEAYYGTDRGKYQRRSALSGLLECRVPMLFAVAEMDLPSCHQQAAVLVEAMLAATGTTPLLTTIPDHTHMSEIFSLGLDDQAFGSMLARFVERPGRRKADR